MALYFFKKQNGTWVLGNNPVTDVTQPNSYRMKSKGNKFSLLACFTRPGWDDHLNLTATDICKDAVGTKYGSLDEFLTSTQDFFSKAPASGGGDDANWLVYQALLTQNGLDAPIAHVLNRDASNYLGDVIWERGDIGNYSFTIPNAPEMSLTFLPSIREYLLDSDGWIGAYMGNNGQGIVQTRFLSIFEQPVNSYPTDDLLYMFPFEIRVRKRATPPQLLSAVINEDGDRVILTFDKKMTNESGVLYQEVTVSNTLYISATDVGNIGPGFDRVDVEDNVVVLMISSNAPTVGKSYVLNNNSACIESFDYGLLQNIENFPVINMSTQQL